MLPAAMLYAALFGSPFDIAAERLPPAIQL